MCKKINKQVSALSVLCPWGIWQTINKSPNACRDYSGAESTLSGTALSQHLWDTGFPALQWLGGSDNGKWQRKQAEMVMEYLRWFGKSRFRVSVYSRRCQGLRGAFQGWPALCTSSALGHLPQNTREASRFSCEWLSHSSVHSYILVCVMVVTFLSPKDKMSMEYRALCNSHQALE
jgi:hypothetical protein